MQGRSSHCSPFVDTMRNTSRKASCTLLEESRGSPGKGRLVGTETTHRSPLRIENNAQQLLEGRVGSSTTRSSSWTPLVPLRPSRSSRSRRPLLNVRSMQVDV